MSKKNTSNENNIPNENNKPIEPDFIPQQPSENSNWKLIDNIFEINTLNNDHNTYIGIFENKIENETKWSVINWKNIIGKNKLWLYPFKFVYRWDGVGEPTIPTINKDTGEITNWNEKIES